MTFFSLEEKIILWFLHRNVNFSSLYFRETQVDYIRKKGIININHNKKKLMGKRIDNDGKEK